MNTLAHEASVFSWLIRAADAKSIVGIGIVVSAWFLQKVMKHIDWIDEIARHFEQNTQWNWQENKQTVQSSTKDSNVMFKKEKNQC
jgi:hypothetical protein